jgi:hypothetical protein
MKKIFLIVGLIGVLSFLAFPAFATEASEEGPVTITGELVILHVDDFDKKSSKEFYQVKDAKTGETFELNFSEEPPGKLRTGSIVTVRGKAKGHTIYLQADTGGQQIETVVASAPTVAGEQKTLVMVTDFLDEAVACSASDIRDRIFTDPLNKSVDDLYQEMSYGQVWFDGDVAGPYVINYSTTSECNLAAWANAADAAAREAGIDPATYQRKIYVLPRDNPCGYVGVGTLGGNPSQSWIFRCDGSDVIAHELGHNVGMNHSATPTSEYGDTSDIMGYSGLKLREINGPHQDQMGWLDPQQIKGVVESGVYMISPIEPETPSMPQIFVIAKPDTGESYYLSYRQPIGFDSGLATFYLQGLSIHRFTPNSAKRTYLLGVLADGQSFTDAINRITVTQLAHTDQYVTVQVLIDNAPVCIPSAPALAISPAGQSGQSGSALSYSVTVTNMDSADCGQSAFTLHGSVPSGWSGSTAPAVLPLGPGETGSATFSVTSPANAVQGDYALSIQSTDTAVPVHTASRDAAYTVLPPPPTCLPAKPVISISPATQSAQAGATVVYALSVTNTDGQDCQATTYYMAVSLPTGWNGLFSAGSLTVAPGATTSASLSVTSSSAASPGDYVLNVAADDVVDSSHGGSRSVIYSVYANTDTISPTAPTGLTANLTRKKIALSWTASTDNTGVAGYTIWRNNVVIGQTSSTSFSDYSFVKGQTYTYFVTAFDEAGNVSAPSNQATGTFNAPAMGRKK